MDSPTVTHLSLCAGYGGIDLGLHRVVPNLRTVAACEIEAFACANLVAKMEAGLLDPAPIWTDLKTFPWAEFRGRVHLLSGGYPCFSAGNLVLTRDRGYAPIESIVVGEHVLTHRGNWKRVSAVMGKCGADTIYVRSAHGTRIECTGEHPFFARTRSGSPEWVEASALQKHHRLGSVLPEEFDNDEWNEHMLWLAGRYLADGYRQRNNGKGRVIFAIRNEKLPEFLRRLDSAQLHGYVDAGQSCSKVHITREFLWCKFAVLGDGCNGKRIPGFFLSLPRSKRLALYQGYVSGDGCVDVSGRVSFVSVNESLVLGIGLLARSVNDTPTGIRKVTVDPTKIIQGRVVNQQPYYRATCALTNRRGFIDGRYCWGEQQVTPGRTGVRVYNLAVEDDESYCVNGCIVHNCQPFSSAGKRLGAADPRHLWPFILDGIRVALPDLCFFENVEGHISLGLSTVIADLEAAGYRATWGIFSAAEVGLPHRRKRVFILAARNHVADGDRGRSRENFVLSQLRTTRTQQSSSHSRVFCEPDQRSQVAFPPARPGCEQFWYEPPRVLANAKNERPGEAGRLQSARSEDGVAGCDEAGDRRLANAQRPGSALDRSGLGVGRFEEPHACRPDQSSCVAQPALGRTPDGPADRLVPTELFNSVDSRIDELRLLGNGVVPATAHRAFTVLLTRLTSSTI